MTTDDQNQTPAAAIPHAGDNPRRNPRAMMGFDNPADKVVSMKLRDWDAMKRAVWRASVAFRVIEQQALVVLDECRHADGCPAADDDYGTTVPGEYGPTCLPECPDREKYLSARVIANAAKQMTQVQATRPADAPYFAPSREQYSETLAALTAAQVEIEELRKAAAPPQLEPPKENA